MLIVPVLEPLQISGGSTCQVGAPSLVPWWAPCVHSRAAWPAAGMGMEALCLVQIDSLLCIRVAALAVRWGLEQPWLCLQEHPA